MPVSEHPMQALAAFLPDGSFEKVVQYIHHYKVHLTISKQRKSVLGDYRHSGWGGNHRISVNGNLNKFEFIITLLHELAHLLTYEQYKNKVDAHGKEWKNHYSLLLIDFVNHKIFPADVERALQKSIINPSATANGETELLLVLRKYDTTKKEGVIPVIEVPKAPCSKWKMEKFFRKAQEEENVSNA
jgi:SprT protein